MGKHDIQRIDVQHDCDGFDVVLNGQAQHLVEVGKLVFHFFVGDIYVDELDYGEHTLYDQELSALALFVAHGHSAHQRVLGYDVVRELQLELGRNVFEHVQLGVHSAVISFFIVDVVCILFELAVHAIETDASRHQPQRIRVDLQIYFHQT